MKDDSLSIGDKNVKISILSTTSENDKDGIQHDKKKKFKISQKKKQWIRKQLLLGQEK